MRRQVLRADALCVLSMPTALGSGIALAAFSVGMIGPAAPSSTPLVYVYVIDFATAPPGRMALWWPPPGS